MSHIYVFSPSSAARDKGAFRRGVARLQALGHEVEVDPAALASKMRFAGDDETRLAAIHRAAASGADIAMISRGGYGLSRLLPQVRYRQLARAIEGGQQWVGLSDFTALQTALLAQAGARTWQGPAIGEDFGCEGEPDEIMAACFEDLCEGRGEGTGWRLPRHSIAGSEPQFRVRNAPLWGGNLCMLCSLVGTPYWPAVDKGILFLEDVGEHPYRIERMLTHLLHAGVLHRQRAIVFGQFSAYRLVPHDKGYTLATALQWLRTQLPARVVLVDGLPFGHVPTKVCLPVGARSDLLVEGRDAMLLWGHA